MNAYYRFLRLAVLFLGSVATCSAETGAPDKATQLDALVTRYEECGYLNGSVLVAQQGRVIYSKGVGMADFKSGVPNTPHTKFGIASITKQFTAALVLEQAERGNLRLDGAVSEYLPWYRPDTGKRMTIEQLIQHTSGLPPDYDNPLFSDSPEAQVPYQTRAFAEKFCQPDLVATPGTKWAYSNCGYLLLGLILERVSGRPYAELLQEQILTPLGMKDTGVDNGDLLERGGAVGYTRHAGPRYTTGARLDHGRLFSAGGMYSTVEDLLRWNQALSGDRLFSRAVREQIFRPAMSDWAGGWFVTRIAPGRPGGGSALAEMRGDLPGNYFAWILHYPEQDAVVIVLRNGYGSTEHFEENVQAVLFGQPPRLPGRAPKDIAARGVYLVAEHWRVSLAAIALIGAGAGMKIRSPKSEGRSKSEDRIDCPRISSKAQPQTSQFKGNDNHGDTNHGILGKHGKGKPGLNLTLPSLTGRGD